MSEDATDSTDAGAPEDSPRSEDGHPPEDVPDWDDEYLDRVSDRLMFNYDLEREFEVRGRTFPMYGEMRIESQKHLFHPSLNYAHNERREHLFVDRVESVSRTDLESLVELGHDLADEWIEADEEHFGTDFTFVVVAPEVPDGVREFVSDFRDRTLLKFGFYGSYEVNLAVVAPESEAAVASREADVASAFRLWESLEETEPRKGLLRRLLG